MDGLLQYLKKNPNADDALPEGNSVKVLKVFVATDVGYVRNHNEDNYFIDELGVRHDENENASAEIKLDRRRVFAVCDGMGGAKAGNIASEMAVETFMEELGKMISSRQ